MDKPSTGDSQSAAQSRAFGAAVTASSAHKGPRQKLASSLPKAARLPLVIGLMLSLGACVSSQAETRATQYFLDPTTMAYTPPAELPDMRWDAKAEADQWTVEALHAVAQKDRALAARVPKDIAQWCPGYAKAGADERRAFWVGLMSAVSKHESTWNAKASGGGGRYIGLMQISPSTAKRHGCAASSSAALKDGAENLSCAVEIFAEQVASDGVVAGNGTRGIGRDWGPFRNASKRAEMAAWTRSQPYCQAS